MFSTYRGNEDGENDLWLLETHDASIVVPVAPMTGPTKLPETERLGFRQMEHGDESSIVEMLSDEYARRFYPDMRDMVAGRRWVEKNLRRYEQHGFGLWMLLLGGTDEVVGDCGLSFQRFDGGRALEVGYHLIARCRGHGYAREAALACLEFGFRNTSEDLICSMVHHQNVASASVAERIHSHRRDCVKSGMPHHLYFTLRADWLGRAG